MRRPPSIRDEALRPPVEYDPPRRKDNLFLWTVFLLLLFGFGLAVWIIVPAVFSRPEMPLAYKLLRKLKRLEEPQRFKVNAAPAGEFLGPERLYSRYNALNGPQLRELNHDLERAYLRNYPVSGLQVPYVTGRFTIMDCYELRETDFIQSGVVAVAVSSDFPKVLIEHVYSAAAQDAPLIRRNLQTGRDIELRRTFELTAVLHVTRLGDGRILLSVMPINYGRYEFSNNAGGFEQQPPASLNVAAGWPIVRGDRLETANQAYVDFRTSSGLGPLAAARPGTGRTPTALVGVDKPVEVGPGEGGIPPGPAAAPAGSPPLVAKNGDESRKSPVPAGTPPAAPTAAPLAQNNLPVRPALPVDPPRRPPEVVPPVISAVPPGQPGRSGTSLQPFLGGPVAGTPAPVNPGRTVRAAWTLYSPGHLPGGKNIRVNEVAGLGQRSASSEPIYLTGQFVVSAVGENHQTGTRNAVLRSGSDRKVRVIVEYPPDRPLPAEGAELSRDEQRPYQIMDVRRLADGTLNVTAREITQP